MSDLQAVYKAIALEVQQQLAKQYPNQRTIYKRVCINNKTKEKLK
ncbi:hypothetical protein [Argonema antarcticum]|nr:hypothetical protein [Argonema antarcticum]